MDYNNFKYGVYFDNGSYLLQMPIAKRAKGFVWKMEWKERQRTKPWLNRKSKTPQERIDYLQSLSTRELMDLRNGCYRCRGHYSWNEADYYQLEEVLEVLNTREHVPNKEEKKRMRREAAKRKR